MPVTLPVRAYFLKYDSGKNNRAQNVRPDATGNRQNSPQSTFYNQCYTRNHNLWLISECWHLGQDLAGQAVCFSEREGWLGSEGSYSAGSGQKKTGLPLLGNWAKEEAINLPLFLSGLQHHWLVNTGVPCPTTSANQSGHTKDLLLELFNKDNLPAQNIWK